MASFRKRGGKWRVQVRRLGHVPLSRTFLNKTDAGTGRRCKDLGREVIDVDVQDDDAASSSHCPCVSRRAFSRGGSRSAVSMTARAKASVIQ